MTPSAPQFDSTTSARLSVIFTKQPTPGLVKTRLCPPLHPEQAAGLAAAMLQDVIERCSAAAARGQFGLELCFTPDGAEGWFRGIAVDLALHAQRGAGLAERMLQAFREALARESVASMVIIGSDQPMLGSARLVEAHQALEAGADLVLGPDAGGGYYLIGMRQPQPALFEKVAMSSANMCESTVLLAESMGLRVRLLAPGYDVDVHADLLRLAKDLEVWNDPRHPDFPRHSQAFIQALPRELLRPLSDG